MNKHVVFQIKGEQKKWYPTNGTIIGYIVQTTATDPGISLSWYDSGETRNVVLGILTSADTPVPQIHKILHVEKIKIE